MSELDKLLKDRERAMYYYHQILKTNRTTTGGQLKECLKELEKLDKEIELHKKELYNREQ